MTDKNLEAVESLMRELAQGDGLSRMGAILSDQLSSGGKRLRAQLALGSVFSLGGDARTAIAWAAACELLHNATLIHDDVQDGDRVRRGQPTVWSEHGIAQAINAGDLMLMLPFSALSRAPETAEVKWRLGLALAQAAQLIVRGQSFEADLMSFCGGPDSFLQYERCVSAKTGTLFGLAAMGGLVVSGRSEPEIIQVQKSFNELGVLFQMQDDVLDLYGNKGREKPGHDIREGKVSCLVAEHLLLHPEDRNWLLQLLRLPREKTSDEDVNRAMKVFVEGGALAAICKKMDAISTQALGEKIQQSGLLSIAEALAGGILESVHALEKKNLEEVRPNPLEDSLSIT